MSQNNRFIVFVLLLGLLNVNALLILLDVWDYSHTVELGFAVIMFDLIMLGMLRYRTELQIE